MNYDDINTFLTIVSSGSISKAAEKLFLSQATVSQRLKSLEEKTGVRLIARQKGIKTIELTAKGQEFIPLAERFLQLMKETEQFRLSEPRRYLSIGCSDSLTTHLFSPLFQELVCHFPQVDFKFRIKNSSEIYAGVEKKELDIGLLVQPFQRRDIITTPIIRDPMVIIQYGEKPYWPGDTLSVRELDKKCEIMQWWGNDYQDWHESTLDPAVRPGINVNTLSLMLSTIQKPGSWAIVPVSVAVQMQKTAPFQVYRIRETPPDRVAYKIVHRNPAAASRQMIDIFTQQLDLYVERIQKTEHFFAGSL